MTVKASRDYFLVVMSPLQHIRINVFDASQAEMAELAGVTQSAVSKWESGARVPLMTALINIRREARRRDLPWDDSWFFER